ncbi:MAG: cation transporter [Clostridia bacterium]|nr:cation transporter [Clostridia bacterium]
MKKIYRMKNLDCAHCAAKMETAIRRLDGVNDAAINFMAMKLTVDFAEGSDLSTVMSEAVKVCKKVEPDCEILL